MNRRRVAITAAALFGTVILVGGVIAAVAGFEMGEASVSNADVVSAAAAVTPITKPASPDGWQRSAAETVPAQLAAVRASDLAHTKGAVSAAGALDESLPESLQTLEREIPPVQVATASTSDLVDSGAKDAASAATLDEQLPDSSQALVPETPPDGKEAVTSTETLMNA
jgi:hypothetical protein